MFRKQVPVFVLFALSLLISFLFAINEPLPFIIIYQLTSEDQKLEVTFLASNFGQGRIANIAPIKIKYDNLTGPTNIGGVGGTAGGKGRNDGNAGM